MNVVKESTAHYRFGVKGTKADGPRVDVKVDHDYNPRTRTVKAKFNAIHSHGPTASHEVEFDHLPDEEEISHNAKLLASKVHGEHKANEVKNSNLKTRLSFLGLEYVPDTNAGVKAVATAEDEQEHIFDYSNKRSVMYDSFVMSRIADAGIFENCDIENFSLNYDLLEFDVVYGNAHEAALCALKGLKLAVDKLDKSWYGGRMKDHDVTVYGNHVTIEFTIDD